MYLRGSFLSTFDRAARITIIRRNEISRYPVVASSFLLRVIKYIGLVIQRRENERRFSQRNERRSLASHQWKRNEHCVEMLDLLRGSNKGI